MIRRQLAFAIMLCLAVFTAPGTLAAAKSGMIELSPSKVLFDISDMKPGDWTERELEVANKTGKPLFYRAGVQFRTGSDMLFSELDLLLVRNGQTIYKGKVRDFLYSAPLQLSGNARDRLIWTIEFPPEAGNEFQGLTCEFVIIIGAEADGGGDSSSPGSGTTPGNPGGADPPLNGRDPDDVVPPGDSEPPGEDTEPEKNTSPPNPSRPEKPGGPEGGSPAHGGGEQGGSQLPNTSTNLYNILLAGLLMTAGGLILLFGFQKKEAAKGRFRQP